MTISQGQRDTYQSAVSDFERQEEPNTCLAIALKNIIDELAVREDITGLKVSKEDTLDMVDYDPFWGCTSDFLPERLNPHLNPHNFEVVEERGLSMQYIEDIITNDDGSYPVVELDERYQKWVTDQDDYYDSLPGTYGNRMPHTVVPFGFNDETVLLFDPFEDYYLPERQDAAIAIEPPQPLFYEWWSGESTPQWTLWCERREQETFERYSETE